MLNLFTWGTPNGHKVHIMLEECDAQYRIVPANINDNATFPALITPVSVNRKIPVLVDDDNVGATSVTIFESGAILLYLAEKYQRFLSTDPVQRYAAVQWLMFQMSAVGPIMGQLNHFKGRANPNDTYTLQRFGTEVQRIHTVMEQHLTDHDYFAGTQYSIADMAVFPWLRLSEKLGIQWSQFPMLHNWYQRIMARPAVQRALQLPNISTVAKA